MKTTETEVFACCLHNLTSECYTLCLYQHYQNAWSRLLLYTQFCFSFLHLFVVCMALLLQGLHGFTAPNWVYISVMLLIPFAPMSSH